jgi:hypothetical protein
MIYRFDRMHPGLDGAETKRDFGYPRGYFGHPNAGHASQGHSNRSPVSLNFQYNFSVTSVLSS